MKQDLPNVRMKAAAEVFLRAEEWHDSDRNRWHIVQRWVAADGKDDNGICWLFWCQESTDDRQGNDAEHEQR